MHEEPQLVVRGDRSVEPNELGVAVGHEAGEDRDPELVRLDGPVPPDHELWLLVHGDLRRSPRVAAVIDWVDALVARARPALTGSG